MGSADDTCRLLAALSCCAPMPATRRWRTAHLIVAWRHTVVFTASTWVSANGPTEHSVRRADDKRCSNPYPGARLGAALSHKLLQGYAAGTRRRRCFMVLASWRTWRGAVPGGSPAGRSPYSAFCSSILRRPSARYGRRRRRGAYFRRFPGPCGRLVDGLDAGLTNIQNCAYNYYSTWA